MSVQQSLQSGTLDPDLTDFSFRVMADNLFLGISNRVPDSIDDNNIATYTIAANAAITSQNLSTIGVTFFARSVSNDLFDTYKQKGGSVVEKVVTVSGMNSGATLTFRIQIT